MVQHKNKVVEELTSQGFSAYQLFSISITQVNSPQKYEGKWGENVREDQEHLV